jgi:DNA helicase-2/ATP-dependent DNA helicase PcrA
MTAPARRSSDLTPQQAAAAAQPGPVLVLAGAGTGKTRTLTAAIGGRIAKRGIAANRILAVTFTNKAAAEMRDRVGAALDCGAAPSWIGTFHGLAARQLREEPEIAGLRPGFDILDADDSRRLLKRTLKALNLADTDDGAGNGRDPLKLMCHRIARFKDDLIIPDEAPAQAEAMIADASRSGLPIDAAGLRSCAQVYGEYQRRLREANAADFGDLLLWPVRAMRADAGYRRRWADRFDCVLADEFQDVNLAQFAWLRLLAADHGEIFVVGDDDQSVYGWRGADVSYIRRFTRDFPGAAVFRLEENFRSTGHILGAANAVIAQDHQRLGKTLFTRKPAGEPLEILRFHDPEAEAAGLVAQIARRHTEGLGWEDMAILYRSNALSRGFEEALMRARIPYALVGDVGFYQRAEIKNALALLRLASTSDDRQADEAFRRVINVPTRGFGPKAMAALEAEAAWRSVSLLDAIETAPLPPKARSAGLAFADAVRRVARNRAATLADQLSLLIDTTGYRRMLRESRAEANEGRLENLQELLQLAGGFHSAREFLDHAALATGGPDDDKAGRVQLMTLHKAKGLEFPQVFLPAWEDGIFPPDYGDPAEERRLAYVAITRGMRRVTVSYCNYRRGPATPSPFIADIPGDHCVVAGLRDPSAMAGLRGRPRDRAERMQSQRRF